MDLKEKLAIALNKIDNKSVLTNYTRKLRSINKIDNGIPTKQALIIDKSNMTEPLILLPLTDLHIGSKHFNYKKFKEALMLIQETDNCYTILLGDLMECATKKSVGLGVYEEDFHVEDQIVKLYELLKPLADSGKILGAVTGNHEMRITYSTSINPVKILCRELDIPYLGYQGYIGLIVGEQTYSILVHHGVGSSSTPAGKLNAMRKLGNVAIADVYLSGHTHVKMHDSDVYMVIDYETGLVKPVKRDYVVCGSFLEYWGGYAEMNLLKPSATGVVSIIFYPDEKNVEVIL